MFLQEAISSTGVSARGAAAACMQPGPGRKTSVDMRLISSRDTAAGAAGIQRKGFCGRGQKEVLG